MNAFETQTFNLLEYIGNDTVENLDNVANYLDYALETSILKQLPDVDDDDEKELIKQIIVLLFKGNDSIFTRQYRIRNNISRIGTRRIKDLLLKTAILKKAFNIKIKQISEDTKYEDVCMTYVTECLRTGNYNQVLEKLNDEKFLDALLDNYVNSFYKQGLEQRSNIEYMAKSIESTKEALENLNKNLVIE